MVLTSKHSGFGFFLVRGESSRPRYPDLDDGVKVKVEPLEKDGRLRVGGDIT